MTAFIDEVVSFGAVAVEVIELVTDDVFSWVVGDVIV